MDYGELWRESDTIIVGTVMSITSEGDESVGIFGGLAEIELGVPLEDLDAEFQSYIIDTFAELFSEIWGEPATVNFMDERGRVDRTEKSIYKDGLRVEKHFFNRKPWLNFYGPGHKISFHGEILSHYMFDVNK